MVEKKCVLMENSSRRRTVRREYPAALMAILAAVALVILIIVGSRGLRDFDSALIGYAVASVVTVAALVYRYTLWIGRPATGRYFRAGWANFLSWRHFRRYALLIPTALWTDILAQTFIRKRGTLRWIAHLSIFWGVILSLAITLPLTFGWFHFTLVPPDHYKLWFFGFPFFTFSISGVLAVVLFHGLDFTAVLLLVGLALVLWRRVTDAGLVSI